MSSRPPLSLFAIALAFHPRVQKASQGLLLALPAATTGLPT